MTLIDKDALLEKLSTFHPDYTFNITSFRNFIKAQPEVEKKGRWRPVQIGGWHGFECTVCKINQQVPCSNHGIPQWKYCPECGARMEESDG